MKYSPNIHLVGMPSDENSSFCQGAALAPACIRQALFSDASNGWSELGIEVLSDSVLVDDGDLSPTFAALSEYIDQQLKNDNRVITFGGDHAITYPIITAYHRYFSELTILQIDAHPDLYDNFQDNPFSHASPFARIMENNLVTRLVQVGIRTFNDHLRKQARKFQVEVIEMHELDRLAQLEFSTPVYLSLDIDGIDPAFAPGVSHPEPGGLSSRDAISIIHNINAPIVGADIVEYNPNKDINGLTAHLAAKLSKEILAKMHLR